MASFLTSIMVFSRHNLWKSLIASITKNEDLKIESNYGMNLLNNELIKINVLRKLGQMA